MNQKKLALFYIVSQLMCLVQVTFGEGQPGEDHAGGHQVNHKDDDKNKNHWNDKKWIYRCAAGSTVTSIVPNFKQATTSDDVLDLFAKQVKCSKVTSNVGQIPVACDWYPTICPDATVYIRGIRKEVNESTPHFEFNCCVNKYACNSNCQDKTATLMTDQRVFYYPQDQIDSDTTAPCISNIMFHDVTGVATMEWKYCMNTTICYTPPPGSPSSGPPGSLLGLLGLLGLLALLAIGKPSSSSAAPGASTAAG